MHYPTENRGSISIAVIKTYTKPRDRYHTLMWVNFEELGQEEAAKTIKRGLESIADDSDWGAILVPLKPVLSN